MSIFQWRLRAATGLLCALVACAGGWRAPAAAEENPFARGWDLNAEASNIRFQSVKNTTKVESSSFATFNGSIEPNGDASITVLLDSVDTQIDLRNVRMRFLFFETFRYPEAKITLKLTPDMVADLATLRRKTLKVPYQFDLHGIRQDMESEIVVTLLTDDLVSVASSAPISIGVEAFGLLENIAKLEEAAGGITIIPSASVTFDFLFNQRPAQGVAVAAMVPAAEEEVIPASVALEQEGDFSLEACVGRFEILSRTGNIYFRTASARLSDESFALLASVLDVVRRCPGLRIEVAGHTDSDGSEVTNQQLSDARARSVAEYLVSNGVEAARINPIGYGAARPVAPNDTADNKARNRRIEFAVIGG